MHNTQRAVNQFMDDNRMLCRSLDSESFREIFGEYASHFEDPGHALESMEITDITILVSRVERLSRVKGSSR